jgi:Uma2 family endonuclease
MIETRKVSATIEDLYLIHTKAELINGEIVELSPTGGKPNRAAMKITLSLYEYERKTHRGIAVGDNAGFIVNLPHRKSFSPDAAFFTGKDPGMKFFEGAPVFAVEVRSENDYGLAAEQKMREKRADYFAAGTQVVWDMDLLGEDVVRVYRTTNPNQPIIYRRNQSAEAEPAVPGWTMPVDDLFS